MALAKIKKPKLYPSFQLGKKPIMGPAVKKPTQYKPRSVSPYVTPAGQDAGQEALYPGGYQGTPRPVDWNTIFTKPGDWVYGQDSASSGSSSGGGGGGGGGPTGGGGLIGGDWEVQAAEAAMGAGMARARGDFQAQIRQALIDLGIGDTTKLGNLSKYIDEDTIKAAVANKYSSNAQIGQQAEKVTAQTRARNAAMGRLSSGETTNRETEIAALAEGNRYTALRGFLEGGATGLSGLADLEGQYAEQIAMARAAAAQRAAETYPDAFAGGSSISPNASGSYAQGVSDWARRNVGNQGPPPTPEQLRGTSNTALTKQQFFRKNPRGNYYNYLRAWHRHAGLPWG